MSQVEKAKNEDFSDGYLLGIPSPNAREIDGISPKLSMSDAPQFSSDSVARHRDDNAKANSARSRDWDVTYPDDSLCYWGA